MKKRSYTQLARRSKTVREDMEVLQQMISRRSVYANRSALYRRRPKHRKFSLRKYSFEFNN